MCASCLHVLLQLEELEANANSSAMTWQVINSVIVKSSKVTKAAKVYRGVTGGLLPDGFWTSNKQGVKGGIEMAFMSTTFDRSVAMSYASVPGRPALVFEMQMGMIDRGAELGWVSQYPFEAECLLAPLTGTCMSNRPPQRHLASG